MQAKHLELAPDRLSAEFVNNKQNLQHMAMNLFESMTQLCLSLWNGGLLIFSLIPLKG